MKTFAIASVIALASVASAQLDKIPSCALSCFVGPLSSDGCAALTDFKCHCEKGSTLIASVQPCVQGACSAADQATAIAAVQDTCKGVGVPINIPNAPGASSAAPAASSAAPAASSAAAVVSSAANVASSAKPAASSAASSAAAAVSSAAASMASRASSLVATPTGNATTPTRPTASQFTGGASQATQAVGLLGAAALAMLAL